MVDRDKVFQIKIAALRSLIENNTALTGRERNSVMTDIPSVVFSNGRVIVCSLTPRVFMRDSETNLGCIEFSRQSPLLGDLSEIKCIKDDDGDYHWHVQDGDDIRMLSDVFILSRVYLALEYVASL